MLCQFAASPALLISSWELVAASRGASDHGKWVEDFAEEIEDRKHDTKDDDCAGQVELAELAWEVALLNLMVVAQGEGQDDDYAAVVNQGNTWLAAVGFTGEQFPEP